MKLKRIAAFVLLVMAGLFVLELARGGADLFPERSPIRGPTTQRVASIDGPVDSDRIMFSGSFKLRETKTVAGRGDVTHDIPTMAMEWADSKPLGRDHLAVESVTLTFYRTTAGAGGIPVGEKTATLTARKMLMELAPGRDPKPAPGKEVVLEDATLTTHGEGVTKGVELRMKKVRAVQEPAALRFWTEGELDPFELIFGEGDSAHRLTGEGLTGSVPAAGAAALAGIDIEMRKNVRIAPVAAGDARAATRLTGGCGGPLTWRSAPGDQQRGVLLLAGGVELDVSGATPGALRVRGERLRLLLRRSGAIQAAPADSSLAILAGDVSGEDVELEAQGSIVRGKSVAFSCGPGGELDRLRVTGDPRLRVPAGALPSGEPVWIHAADAIEVLLLPPLSAFGLSSSAPTRWISFQGRTWTSDDSLAAESGLLIATGDENEGSELWLRSYGRARLAVSGIAVEGDGGLTLRRSATGDGILVRVNERRARERFSAKRAGGQALEGHGSLELRQDPGGATTLELQDGTSVRADLRDGVVLNGPFRMKIISAGGDPQIEAEGDSLRLDDEARGVFVRNARTIVTGEQGAVVIRGLLRTGPDGSVVRELATLEHRRAGSADPVKLSAIHIELLPSLAGKPAIVAIGHVKLELSGFEMGIDPGRGAGSARPPGAGVTRAELLCDHFVMLPALLPEGDAAFACLPAGARWSRELAAALTPAGPGWFRADGGVRFDLASADGSGQVFHGETMVARADGLQVVLRGIGSRFRIERPGSSAISGTADHILKEGDRLMIGGGPERRGATLYLKGDLFAADEAGAAPQDGGTTRIECGRPIEVTESRIWTIGPTLITTFDPAGEPLPDGLEMRCMGFDATRVGGEITHVTALGPVTVRRGTFSGSGNRLLYDLRTGWLTLESGDRPAEIVIERGLHGIGDVLEYNVRTHAIGVVRGTLVPRARGFQ